MAGINIYSGEKGLGGALTNPTELAFRKESIQNSYPVKFRNREFADVEEAYHVLAGPSPEENDKLMALLIACKFEQHPMLFQAVIKRGGVAWLDQCSHFTYAKSEGFQAWEGQGRESRFIRNLIAGFELAMAGQIADGNQQSLF